MNGLDRITAKIISDAEAAAKATLDAAKDECAKIDADYAKRAAELRDSMFTEAESEASNTVSRVKSTAAIEKRNVLLDEKSKLVDEAFTLAANEIHSMPAEKYTQLLTDILVSVMQNQFRAEETERRDYGGDELEETEAYEVVMNKTDAETHGKDVVKAAKAVLEGKTDKATADKLKLSEKTEPIDGGLLLRYGDIEINCSLSMIFSRLRENCETEVYKILFKE